MPTRIENILLRARDTLADPNAERYSDSRLLRLLSDGLKDIVSKSKSLRARTTFLPIKDVAEYQLPDDVWIITRASFRGEKMNFVTHDGLDHDNCVQDDWIEYSAASPYAIVYDRVDQGIVRLYPIPNDELVDEVFLFASDFGVITSIDGGYTMASVFGVSLLAESSDEFNVVYNTLNGEITSIVDLPPEITIWYYALAPEITTVNDNLKISYLYDTALKHYVTGYALRDDVDTQSRQMGAEEIALYQAELAVAKKASSINFNSNVDRQIQYTGPFQQ